MNPFCPRCGAVVGGLDQDFSFQNATNLRIYIHTSTCPNNPKNLISSNNSSSESRGSNFKRFIAFIVISIVAIIGKSVSFQLQFFVRSKLVVMICFLSLSLVHRDFIFEFVSELSFISLNERGGYEQMSETIRTNESERMGERVCVCLVCVSGVLTFLLCSVAHQQHTQFSLVRSCDWSIPGGVGNRLLQ
jgi:hypothetical protein